MGLCKPIMHTLSVQGTLILTPMADVDHHVEGDTSTGDH